MVKPKKYRIKLPERIFTKDNAFAFFVMFLCVVGGSVALFLFTFTVILIDGVIIEEIIQKKPKRAKRK